MEIMVSAAILAAAWAYGQWETRRAVGEIRELAGELFERQRQAYSELLESTHKHMRESRDVALRSVLISQLRGLDGMKKPEQPKVPDTSPGEAPHPAHVPFPSALAGMRKRTGQ